MKQKLLLFLMGAGMVISSETWAARGGRIDGDHTRVYETPELSGEVIEELDRDVEVTASNLATHGFHKVRTPSGKVGWIQSTHLILEEIPTAEDSVEIPTQKKAASPLEEILPVEHFRLRQVASLNLYNASNIVVGAPLTQGLSAGAELSLNLSQKTALVARGEILFRSYGVSTQSQDYFVELRTYPVTGGLRFQLMRASFASIEFSLLAGMAFLTQVKSTPLSDPVPLVYETRPLGIFTGLSKLDFNLNIAQNFMIFFEAGYRYLKSPPIFIDAGANVPFGSSVVVDLSGPVVGGGLSIRF